MACSSQRLKIPSFMVTLGSSWWCAVVIHQCSARVTRRLSGNALEAGRSMASQSLVGDFHVRAVPRLKPRCWFIAAAIVLSYVLTAVEIGKLDSGRTGRQFVAARARGRSTSTASRSGLFRVLA